MELGISEFWVCKERWGPEMESGISESWVCKERWGPGLEYKTKTLNPPRHALPTRRVVMLGQWCVGS